MLDYGDVGQRVEGGRLVERVDGDREALGDDVVAGAAVIDGDGDRGGADGVSDGGEGDRARSVGAGVVDRGSRDQVRIAGRGRDRECLYLVGCAGGDARQVNGLEHGILVDGNVGQRVKRRSLVNGVDGNRKAPGDNVVAGSIIVDSQGDRGGAEAVGQ